MRASYNGSIHTKVFCRSSTLESAAKLKNLIHHGTWRFFERARSTRGGLLTGPFAMLSVPDAKSGLGPLCTNPNNSATPASCNAN